MFNDNQTDGSVALSWVAKKPVVSTVIRPTGNSPTKSSITHVDSFTKGQR